jgi:MFS family permease
MSVQAFFYNAFFFGYADVLSELLATDATKLGWHLLILALGNFSGPLFLGRLVDAENGRRWTMTVTFLVSGMLLAITAFLFIFSGGDGTLGFDPRYLSVAWAAIFFASTAASTAYLTSGELFPLEIRARAFAVVFTASMVVGGVVGAALFSCLAGEEWHQALPYLYLLTAFLMILVALIVAPPENATGPVLLRLSNLLRLSKKYFPDRAGQPLVDSAALSPR